MPRLERDFIVAIDRAVANDNGRVGAKLARLGVIDALGLPVPPGFAVTVDAFREHVAHGHLLDELLAIERNKNDDPEVASQRATACVEHSELPAAIEDGIGTAYRALSQATGHAETATAVRSSAIGEDSATWSFAGQYESYLGITGTAEICQHVKRVWSSLFSTRAVAYRRERRVSFEATPMAVGVLQLIHAEASGVAFTQDPIAGKRDRIVIESVWGLGEAVVQGLVTPDRIEVDKEEERVISCRAGKKEKQLVFDHPSQRTAWQTVAPNLIEAKSLTAEDATGIARIAVRLERSQGQPIDLEWVKSNPARGGRVFALQFRPVTAAASPRIPHWSPSRSLRG